ncbi:MAG TPA: MarR family transcriptional regulator [Amycolatopsis sp.]|uniref:GbsR/MarR family transcriptional regulator n=1 Tax=Amycolatopsis sp. TaxID=37632 RepID=UPI002B4878A2|nr:MarR family transcriptional regulator [Amycolatopsis sp.]HKS44628.1 MarR family transcriptional regulator [Amycolatopsis sp.]
MSSRPQSQRDPAEDDAVLRFVEKFALLLTNAGMARMPARVFSALLVAGSDGMTAAELAEMLQISPAAVSGAVRYNMQLNMIERGRRPGERRDHYFIGDEQWYYTVGHRDVLFRTLCDALDEGVQAVGPNTDRGRRLAETRDFFNFLAKELPMLVERWRQHWEAKS